MGPQGEDGHKGGPGERGRPAKLIGDDRPGNKRRVLCKSGMNCNWKPKCRFGHPEGGNNMDKITKDAPRVFDREKGSWRVVEAGSGSWKQDEQEEERRRQLNRERRGETDHGLRSPGGSRRTPPKMRRSTKQCRSGPSCTWKPFCLFLHKVGELHYKISVTCRPCRREETITSSRIRTSLPRKVERSRMRRLGQSRRLLKRF